VTWSRLLVEANRASTNPRIWSSYTAVLSRDEREAILERYWWPHRREVEGAVRDEIARGFRVFHVAVHSFTPELHGEVRNADIDLDSRSTERALCRRWRESVRGLAPNLRVRMNYPYQGMADGLPTWLRRRFPERRYAGVELEFNQACLRGAGRRRLAAVLGASLEELLRPGS
jgi:predicted N-formylglutamate amidohydrolase